MQNVDDSPNKGTTNKEMINRFFIGFREAASIGTNPPYFSLIVPSINVIINAKPQKTFNFYRNITTP